MLERDCGPCCRFRGDGGGCGGSRLGALLVARAGVASLTYQLAAVWSCIASADRDVKVLGVGLAVTGIAAGIVDYVCLASIWCAFAAVVSLLVVRAVRRDARQRRTSRAALAGVVEVRGGAVELTSSGR